MRSKDIVNPRKVVGSKHQRESLSPREYCERVTNVVSSEIPSIMFAVLMVHERCDALLKQLYYDLVEPLKKGKCCKSRGNSPKQT